MTDQPKDGGPAFPSDMLVNDSVIGRKPYSGMSLRDAAALAALPAIIRACRYDVREDGETIEAMFARKAWAVADAMLAAREGGEV